MPDVTPSRLMAYFDGRLLEGDGATSQDCGANIRDVIKGIVTSGLCPETEWPFDPSKVCVPPSPNCYTDAANFRATSYEAVDQTEIGIKTCLYEDYPVVFGFTVFNDFMSQEVANTGIVSMPDPSDSPIGGHAVVIVGYDDATRRFKIRNSWGTGWGIDGSGYFSLPYEYVLDPNLSSDFWVIKLMGSAPSPVAEPVTS